jgi:putative methionine-R-sulfoxide reductase with GAF domain
MTDSAEKTRGGRERRRYRRRNVVDREMVTVELGGGRTGILIDLSKEGMAVQPFLPIPTGTELDFHFDLPRGAGRIQGRAVVTSAAQRGRAGLRFLHLSDPSITHLDGWLRMTRDPFAVPEQESLQVKATAQHLTASGLESQELDTQTALEMVAARARVVTRADGAAIIIAAANGGFVCRASAGKAPPAGSAAALDASLTGECLRTGVIVSCGDAQSDPRVNPVACERLGVRSVLVVPVLANGGVSGAVEVLSSAAQAFREKDLARLRELADITSSIVASELAGPVLAGEN